MAQQNLASKLIIRPHLYFAERWQDDMRLVREMCSEAGVTIYEV